MVERADEPPLTESARVRIDNFVDSAFAFAVTLLVISTGGPPSDLSGLKHALWGVPGFAAGFAIVAMFWWTHRSYSRVRPEGGVPLLLSLAIVFVILVYVYPLRLFSDMFVRFLAGAAVEADGPLQSAARMRDLYLIYGAGFTTLALLYLAAFLHAEATARRVGDTLRMTYAGNASAVWMVLTVAGAASISLAAILPFRSAWAVSIPGFAYALIPVGIGVVGHLRRKKAPPPPKVEAESDA